MLALGFAALSTQPQIWYVGLIRRSRERPNIRGRSLGKTVIAQKARCDGEAECAGEIRESPTRHSCAIGGPFRAT